MNHLIKLLLVIDGLFSFALGLIGPIYAIFVEQIGGDLLVAGEAWAIFSITSGVMIYIIGKWEDRQKHKNRLVTAGLSLQTIGIIGYYFVAEPMQLFFVQILLGVGSAIYIPVYDAFFMKSIDRRHEAEEWGAWEGSFHILEGVAALIGSYIAFTLGFKTLFLLMAICGLGGTLLSFKLHKLD